MKKLFLIFAALNIAALALSACAPAPAPAAETVGDNASVAENPTGVAGAEAVAPADPGDAVLWTQDYITQVPPIMMIEPYFEIFGQTAGPVPYYYEEAVKLAGHSCGAVAGAWTITKKALEALYPNGEYPVRGQIFVEAPGAEDEWFVGVFGDVIMYITGAAPKTGFNGSDFAVNDLHVRQNKMIYTEKPTNQLPPMREWIFTRLDTGAKVGVKFNLAIITPLSTPARVEMGKKMALGQATPEEAADYIKYWNDRAFFVFENADMDGFFTIVTYDK